MKFFDLLGNEIEVGDIVTVAATVNQSGELRIGRVLELIEKSKKVRTQWYVGFSGYGGNNKATLIGGNDEWVLTGRKDPINNRRDEMVKTGNIKMKNFLCLHKARDYKPEN